jgi:hypothetical protein
MQPIPDIAANTISLPLIPSLDPVSMTESPILKGFASQFEPIPEAFRIVAGDRHFSFAPFSPHHVVSPKKCLSPHLSQSDFKQ